METQNPTIEVAIKFIKTKHATELDWTGLPYYLHPIAVMNLLPESASHDDKLIALFHDVIEDTDATEEDLIQMGCSDYVVKGVYWLSRNNFPDMSYMDYIRQIINSGHEGALQTKFADNKHNTDPDRISRISDPVIKQKCEDMSKGRYKKTRKLLEDYFDGRE